MNHVLAGGHRQTAPPFGGVEHREKRLPRVVKHASLSEKHRGGTGDFLFGLRDKDRLGRIFFGLMVGAFRVGFLDEEIVHEGLPSAINRNHFGRAFQIWHGHRLGGVRVAVRWRPRQW